MAASKQKDIKHSVTCHYCGNQFPRRQVRKEKYTLTPIYKCLKCIEFAKECGFNNHVEEE
jgi:NAD-dependent SIR2 family protein deacetylase